MKQTGNDFVRTAKLLRSKGPQCSDTAFSRSVLPIALYRTHKTQQEERWDFLSDRVNSQL
jgi:hypothetical protein